MACGWVRNALRLGVVWSAVSCLAIGGCTTFTVRQSALVPAAVLPNPGHRDGVINLHASDSTVTFLARPERAPNSDAGLWITRHLFQVGMSVAIHERLALRLNGLYGLSEGAMAAAPTTLQNPGINTWGIGTGLDVRINEEAHHLNLTLDFRLLAIPTFFEATCTSGPCGGDDRVGRRHEGILQGNLSLTYGFDFDPTWRGLFAISVLNHPTNAEEIASPSASSDVDAGPLNLILGVGVDVTITEGLGVIPMLQWPVTRDPVVYGPILSLGLRGSIPEPKP
jgi:hypothetical protein